MFDAEDTSTTEEAIMSILISPTAAVEEEEIAEMITIEHRRANAPNASDVTACVGKNHPQNISIIQHIHNKTVTVIDSDKNLSVIKYPPNQNTAL